MICLPMSLSKFFLILTISWRSIYINLYGIQKFTCFSTNILCIKFKIKHWWETVKNSIDYFKCMQHAGWSPVTHHTTPSRRDWVTIDYKHTSQSIHSTLGRSAETYPTTLSHRDWDLPVHTYWSTGWKMNPQPWGLWPQAQPLSQWIDGRKYKMSKESDHLFPVIRCQIV